MSEDERFMRRAIDLARQGAGFVSPNPMVGCVIVKHGNVIAEGRHKRFGGSHAEVVALGRYMIDDKRFIGATMYVNLEPCVHMDKKTPPCVPEIIRAGISRVVIGMKDPNPKVNGQGVFRLQSAGIEVETEILREACEALNEAFIGWIGGKE